MSVDAKIGPKTLVSSEIGKGDSKFGENPGDFLTQQTAANIH